VKFLKTIYWMKYFIVFYKGSYSVIVAIPMHLVSFSSKVRTYVLAAHKHWMPFLHQSLLFSTVILNDTMYFIPSRTFPLCAETTSPYIQTFIIFNYDFRIHIELYQDFMIYINNQNFFIS